MTSSLTVLSPLQQAEHVLQVERVLRRMEGRFEAGAWTRGARVGDDGSSCLVGAVDEATRWCMPGVAEEVTRRLATGLPLPFRAVARARPRLALALFNDTVGGERGSRALVRAARRELLAGAPAPVSDIEPLRAPWSVAGRV
jgi:hypothetical protein